MRYLLLFVLLLAQSLPSFDMASVKLNTFGVVDTRSIATPLTRAILAARVLAAGPGLRAQSSPGAVGDEPLIWLCQNPSCAFQPTVGSVPLCDLCGGSNCLPVFDGREGQLRRPIPAFSETGVQLQSAMGIRPFINDEDSA